MSGRGALLRGRAENNGQSLHGQASTCWRHVPGAQGSWRQSLHLALMALRRLGLGLVLIVIVVNSINERPRRASVLGSAGGLLAGGSFQGIESLFVLIAQLLQFFRVPDRFNFVFGHAGDAGRKRL